MVGGGLAASPPPPISCPDSSGIKGKEKGRSEAVAGAEPPALRLQPPWGAELSPPPIPPPAAPAPPPAPTSHSLHKSHAQRGDGGLALTGPCPPTHLPQPVAPLPPQGPVWPRPEVPPLLPLSFPYLQPGGLELQQAVTPTAGAVRGPLSHLPAPGSPTQPPPPPISIPTEEIVALLSKEGLLHMPIKSIFQG